jgi:hypothetical protein
MHGVGYRVVDLDRRLAPLRELPGNIVHLGRTAALLGGANYSFEPGYPREPLRALVAALVIVAIAAPVAAFVKLTLARAAPLQRAFACYWGAASVLLCASFVLTPKRNGISARRARTTC